MSETVLLKKLIEELVCSKYTYLEGRISLEEILSSITDEHDQMKLIEYIYMKSNKYDENKLEKLRNDVERIIDRAIRKILIKKFNKKINQVSKEIIGNIITIENLGFKVEYENEKLNKVNDRSSYLIKQFFTNKINIQDFIKLTQEKMKEYFNLKNLTSDFIIKYDKFKLNNIIIREEIEKQKFKKPGISIKSLLVPRKSIIKGYYLSSNLLEKWEEILKEVDSYKKYLRLNELLNIQEKMILCIKNFESVPLDIIKSLKKDVPIKNLVREGILPDFIATQSIYVLALLTIILFTASLFYVFFANGYIGLYHVISYVSVLIIIFASLLQIPIRKELIMIVFTWIFFDLLFYDPYILWPTFLFIIYVLLIKRYYIY